MKSLGGQTSQNGQFLTMKNERSFNITEDQNHSFKNT